MMKCLRQQLAVGNSMSRFFSTSSFMRQETAEPKTATTATTAAKPVPNSKLYTLRKTSGYGLSKCKEALEKFEGNVEEANKWLDQQAQTEGWTKADKLKDRQTLQGTLVLFHNKIKKQAALVELNCETDFVAKNEKFLEMSSKVAMSVLDNIQPSDSHLLLNKDALCKLNYMDESGKPTERTIADQLALAIGAIGENMSLRRAIVYNIQPNQHLSWYMHGSTNDPINNCHFGKYGCMVLMTMYKPIDKYQPFEIGRQIAQHVVGMKPKTIGEWIDTESASTTEAKPEPTKIDDSESRLYYQEFLMKPQTRVIDFLHEQNTKISEFVRFECGESLE